MKIKYKGSMKLKVKLNLFKKLTQVKKRVQYEVEFKCHSKQ